MWIFLFVLQTQKQVYQLEFAKVQTVFYLKKKSPGYAKVHGVPKKDTFKFQAFLGESNVFFNILLISFRTFGVCFPI